MSNQPYTVKSFNKCIVEEIRYITDINNGLIVPSTSGFKYIDDRLLGGFNKSDIITIGGLSGSGKTSHILDIGMNTVQQNTDTRMCYLSFEMPGRKLVSRKVSSDIKKSLKELYTKGATVDFSSYKALKDLAIDVVETPINVDVITDFIDMYCNKHHNSRIICVIDHTLLVSSRRGDNELETIRELSIMVNKLKKLYNIVFIMASQLNNAMLDVRRLSTQAGQYPNQTDIFGSKSIYHVSDNIIILVNPSKLNIGTKLYGPDGLPLNIKVKGKIYEYIYAHTIKARDGEVGVDPLINNLKYNKLIEYDDTRRATFRTKYGV